MRFFTLKLVAASMLTMVSATNAIANDVLHSGEIIKTSNVQLVKVDEVRQRQLAWEVAPVKTTTQLKALLKTESPLDLLSPAAKKRFIDGLVFRKNGLGSMYIGDLELELTPTEIHHLLSLFGAQHVTKTLTNARIDTKLDKLLLKNTANSRAADYKGYSCVNEGTCKRTTNDYICTSNC